MTAIPMPTLNAGPRFVAAPVKVEVDGVVVLAPVLGIATSEVGGMVVAWKGVVELVDTIVIVEALVELPGTRFVKKAGILVETAGTNVAGREKLVVEFAARNVAKVGVVVKEFVVVMRAVFVLVSIAGIAAAGVEKTIGVVVGTVEAG